MKREIFGKGRILRTILGGYSDIAIGGLADGKSLVARTTD